MVTPQLAELPVALPEVSSHQITESEVYSCSPSATGSSQQTLSARETPRQLKVLTYSKANRAFHRWMQILIEANTHLVGKIELPGNEKMPQAYVCVPKNHPLAKQVTLEKIYEWEIKPCQVIVTDKLDGTSWAMIDPEGKFGLKMTKVQNLLEEGAAPALPPTDEPSDVDEEDNAVEPIKYVRLDDEKCICGNNFVVDFNFCRICGKQRPIDKIDKVVEGKASREEFKKERGRERAKKK